MSAWPIGPRSASGRTASALAEHCLKLLGFTVYSPRLRTYRIWRDRRRPIVVPLLPGYLFVEIMLQWRAAYQSLSVCSIVKNGHARAVVPDAGPPLDQAA